MVVRGWTGFTGTSLTGTPTGDNNRLMCLSCHFAHGVSADMMLFANNTRVSGGSAVAGTENFSGQNDVSGAMGAFVGSSALKRYINQAACWHCHVSSASTPFMNTEYYWSTFSRGPTW
jgi:cytochrome c